MNQPVTTFGADDLRPLAPLNRADGCVRLSVKPGPAIDRLYQRGASKVVFPRADALTAVLVNTAGGVTGGDRFEVDVEAGGSVTLTSQTAERAYRSLGGTVGRVRTRITARAGTRVNWLPQETILFDECAFDRATRIDLEGDAEALLVEALIFGRHAMGELSVNGSMRERMEIRRDGRPVYLDAWTLDGCLTDEMDRPALGAGARAMATVLFASPRAEAWLERLGPRATGPCGLSLIRPDLLALRVLGESGYAMRKTLLPLLDQLTDNTLPICWRL